MLEEIAGPGATIRVDGFTGGRLPTREQIARIVVRRDAFSAEFHQMGQGRVEIATRPGVDRWRGNAGLNVRPSALSAHNAVARTSKGGTLMRMNAFIAGPLVRNRISFAAEVAGSSSEDMRGIAAVTPAGPFVAALPQPFDNMRSHVSHGRVAHQDDAVPRLGGTREHPARQSGHLRTGLPERGYRREDVDHSARLSLEGGQRRPLSRALAIRSGEESHRSRTPLRRRSIVQSAFRSGGATMSGDDRARAIVERHHVYAEGASLHLARGLADELELQRAGTAQ